MTRADLVEELKPLHILRVTIIVHLSVCVYMSHHCVYFLLTSTMLKTFVINLYVDVENEIVVVHIYIQ